MSIGLALAILAVAVFAGFLGFKIARREDTQGSGGGRSGRKQHRH